MKRPAPWEHSERSSSSSSPSSSSDTDTEKTKRPKISQGKFTKPKSSAIDFETSRKHGYKGGLSVLNVPPPREEPPQDWTWSTGKDRPEIKEESFEERQETRAKLMEGELLANVRAPKEKKSLSFSQKEKRKRDIGQASRGKNYVEEEKRLLRESGIYSSFDT